MGETRGRVRALADDAVRVGTAYERARAGLQAAVDRRTATLAQLDEAVVRAEEAVTAAVAEAGHRLSVDTAAVVLGLSPPEVRRAVRAANGHEGGTGTSGAGSRDRTPPADEGAERP